MGNWLWKPFDTWLPPLKIPAKNPGFEIQIAVVITAQIGNKYFRLLAYGILNPFLSALLFPLGCSINTPPDTRINANKVPMLVRSVTSVRFKNKAGMATKKPVTMVAKAGVLYFLCSLENRGGKSPSRLMLIHIRGWPT